MVLNKVVIYGVGLIGGSFALALKKARAAGHIVGIGRTQSSLVTAKELGIIDEIGTSVQQAMRQADLVLVAAPVAQTGWILSEMAPYLEPDTVVTDAGSTKSGVVAVARAALGGKSSQFVPGHPIAGAEKNGPEAATEELYAGKKVVLTPLSDNPDDAVARVAAAWEAAGATIHTLSPEEHDRVFASVSHLPHLLAYALVDDIARKEHADTLFAYAASGFRDFTRIAASSPEMWRDIAMANKDALLSELDAYTAQLATLRQALSEGDADSLYKMFANAQQARQKWGGMIESAEKNNVPA